MRHNPQSIDNVPGPGVTEVEEVYGLTPRRKYGSRKVELDGYVFDSALEARRYQELRLRQKAGEIGVLGVHPKFDLLVKGCKVGSYKADFSYYADHGVRYVVEDCKSGPTRTTAYRLRKKLMKAIYGIQVVEITAEEVRS